MLLKTALTTLKITIVLMKIAVSAALGVMVYGILHKSFPEWTVIIVASVFGGNLGPVLTEMVMALALNLRARKELSNDAGHKNSG